MNNESANLVKENNPTPPFVETPLKKNNIFKILFFITFIIFTSIATTGFLLANKNKQKADITIDINKNPETVSIAPEVTDDSLNQENSSIQKSYYGEFQLQIPTGWKEGGCSGVGCPINIIPLNASNETEDIITVGGFSEKEISPYIYRVLNDKEAPDSYLIDFSKNLNFNVPNINNANNATFKKNSTVSIIYFKYRGVIYYFYADYSNGSKFNLSSDDLDQILKKYVSSITFFNEPPTCKEPTLLPLTDFPNNFSLYNYHESDISDPVFSFWPNTKSEIDPKYPSNKQSIDEAAARDSGRGFMVNYIKDGNIFIEDGNLSKTMIPILPNPDLSNEGYGDKTGIWHLNCIDTQEDSAIFPLPYHLSDGKSSNDLFAINIYVNDSVKAKLLWNTPKWNIELLQNTRSKVYIRRGSTWQAYKAIGYFATMPTEYGGKPAIYLYSPQPQSVNVEIHPRGQLIKTDNEYNPTINGWQVTAGPKGILNSQENYLYYEAMLPVKQPSTGYIVPYSQLFTFSKEYIKELGLNEEESNEFISFWKEKLPESPYYFVSHLDQKTISEIYPLNINPTPDTLIRVEIYFKPLLEKINISPPIKSPPIKRNGFVAVEWGGIFDLK